MAPSTRNFLAGSAVVVVAGLCTGLVAFYSGALPGRDTARTEFSYIPSDVSAVGFADVRNIMNSPFLQKLREVMPTGAEKDRMLAETGIDIERDIDSVVAGLSGADSSGALVLLRGRFDRNRIEALALQHGMRQEQYGGNALLVGTPVAPGAEGSVPGTHVPSIAFLGEGLLAIGEASGVRRAIDVAASGDGVTGNSEMMRFINTVQGTGNAWMVGRADQVANQPQMPEMVRSQMQGLQWLSVSADIDRDVTGMIRGEARDDQSAQQMRTMLAGALAAARMFGEQDARAAAALNAVQASGTGRNVELSFQLPASLLEFVPSALSPTPSTPPAPTPAP
jgi:hypothetical protein